MDIAGPGGFWNPEEFPLVIAGPCSAESEEQVLRTARQLAKIPEVKVFRSGLWKPRTRPGTFEGVGEKGLLWLEKVKGETGLMTTVEVARPEHVELALKHQSGFALRFPICQMFIFAA